MLSQRKGSHAWRSVIARFLIYCYRAYEQLSGSLRLPGNYQNPRSACPSGVFLLEFLMRTYDKLIATIFDRQGSKGLRSFPGCIARSGAQHCALSIAQEAG